MDRHTVLADGQRSGVGAEESEDSPPGTRRSASALETGLAELAQLKMGQNLCPPSPRPDPDVVRIARVC